MSPGSSCPGWVFKLKTSMIVKPMNDTSAQAPEADELDWSTETKAFVQNAKHPLEGINWQSRNHWLQINNAYIHLALACPISQPAWHSCGRCSLKPSPLLPAFNPNLGLTSQRISLGEEHMLCVRFTAVLVSRGVPIAEALYICLRRCPDVLGLPIYGNSQNLKHIFSPRTMTSSKANMLSKFWELPYIGSPRTSELGAELEAACAACETLRFACFGRQHAWYSCFCFRLHYFLQLLMLDTHVWLVHWFTNAEPQKENLEICNPWRKYTS